jgi:hypothetical protein
LIQRRDGRRRDARNELDDFVLIGLGDVQLDADLSLSRKRALKQKLDLLDVRKSRRDQREFISVPFLPTASGRQNFPA